MAIVKNQKELDEWIAQEDAELELFLKELPQSVSSKLDYSIDSLDVLEAWLLGLYASSEAAAKHKDTLIFDRAGRYIAKVTRFVATEECCWYSNFKDADNFVYFRPALIGGGVNVSLVPAYRITTACDRRTGIFLSTVTRNIAENAQSLKSIVNKAQGAQKNPPSIDVSAKYRVLMFDPLVKQNYTPGSVPDKTKHLIPAKTLEFFIDRLISYGYDLITEAKAAQAIYQSQHVSVKVIISKTMIAFHVQDRTSDSTFEALQTATELSDRGDLVVYDPQQGEWIET
jgi:hypothetical protein